jgi:hypothetical protein
MPDDIDLYMNGLKGINVAPWPQSYSSLLKHYISNIVPDVDYSLVEFHLNEQLIGELECHRPTIE